MPKTIALHMVKKLRVISIIATSYQFPMGKVEVTWEQAVVDSKDVYWFPMVRLKTPTAAELAAYEGYVYRFPMGKIEEISKVGDNPQLKWEYRFPIGKVKVEVTTDYLLR